MAAHRWLNGPMADTALAHVNNPTETAGTAVKPARVKLLVWSKGQELNFSHFIYLLIKQASANCFWLSNSSTHGTFRYKDICMFKDYPLKLHADFCFGQKHTRRSVFLVNIWSAFLKKIHIFLKYLQIQSCITHHLKPQNATDKIKLHRSWEKWKHR